jgi:hypothetical protein
MSDKKCYVNKDGKKVCGTAAELHIISQNGGWELHHEQFATETIEKFVKKEVRTSQLLKPEEQRIRRVK